MPLISCSEGRLHTVSWESPQRVFRTGLGALDDLMPQGLAKGAVHEVLGDGTRGVRLGLALGLGDLGEATERRSDEATKGEEDFRFSIFDLQLRGAGEGTEARRHEGTEGGRGWKGTSALPSAFTQYAVRNTQCSSIANCKLQIANPPPRPLVWCSPHPAPYAPALVNAGIDLRRVWVVRTRSESDTVWAAAECLRCKGVGAVFAEVERLSTIEARRLQLAAEEGGGVGILLRPARAALMHYAAATRWLVRPWPGERTIQRFKVELLHGHGGRIGQSIVLEISRETDHVRAVGAVAGGSGKAAVAAAG